MSSSTPAPPGPLSKPLPDPPDLPYPPVAALVAVTAGEPPRSDLALDARSLEHLADILRQSFANVKLQEEVWLVSAVPCAGCGTWGESAVHESGGGDELGAAR